jgi:hypothetical protein
VATFRVQVKWNVKELGPVIKAVADAVSKNIQTRSRADIASSGLRHPARFVRGLRTYVKTAPRKGYRVQVFLSPAYSHVWEYGGTSVGKPMLWIAQPGAPRRVGSYGGKLFRPKGTNVLMSRPSRVKVTGIMGSGTSKPKVMYVGVKSVTHARRFHLRQIAYDEANKLTDIMARMMK